MAQLVKTVQGLSIASVKTVQGLAIASAKTIMGLDNTSSGGGISLVSSVSATGSINGSTTGSIDTTGANLIVVSIYYYTGSSLTVTDSKSNTWTALTSRGSTILAKQYYCAGATVGSGHTFTLSGIASYSGIAVAAFSGANASPFDTESGASATQPGSITPAVANELFVTAWGRNDATTLTINSSFTIAEQTAYAPGDGFSVGLAYKISSGAENPTMNTDDGTSMAAFKPA